MLGKRLLWVGFLAAAGMTYVRADDGALRVSEEDLRKAAVTKVKPEYPSMARQLHLAGRVEVDVFVDATGDVERVEPKSGNPLFTSAAAAALKKWKFAPFKADGKAVKAAGPIRIDFASQ